MEGDQVTQAGPLLTRPDQFVVLYLLCDGALNDPCMTFPDTEVSCQARPVVPLQFLTMVTLLN